MIQRDQLACDGVKRGDVRALVEIAVRAREARVSQTVVMHVLSRLNMLDVECQEGRVLLLGRKGQPGDVQHW